MRITLMHNPTAGEGKPKPGALMKVLKSAGYDPIYQSTKEKRYEKALRDPGDFVVVAGGDGTVAKIAKQMAGRRIPLAILPTGTANNFAKGLGITQPLEEVVAGWSEARRKPSDLGIVSLPWGESRFLEGIGFGLFARVIAEVNRLEERRSGPTRSSEERLDIALDRFKRVLSGYRPTQFELYLDDENVSGEYLGVEALIIKALGANLFVAPGADIGDAHLQVVLLAEEDRYTLLEYIEALRGGEGSPPRFTIRRCRQLRAVWEGVEYRIDDESYPAKGNRKKMLRSAPFEIAALLRTHALEFLVPGGEEAVRES